MKAASLTFISYIRICFFASRMKMIVEPTGCLGFAAARQMKAELQGRRVGVIVSGGNVDLARFCSLLSAQG